MTRNELINFLHTEIDKCNQHSIFDNYLDWENWNAGFKEALIVVLEKITEKDDDKTPSST